MIKKLLLVAYLFFMFSLIVNAQQKTYTVIKQSALDSLVTNAKNLATALDTSANFKFIVNKLSVGTQALANGLKVGANELWDILKRQQVVKSFTYLLLLLSSLLLDLLIIKGIKACFKEFVDAGKENGVGYWFLIIFMSVVGIGWTYFNSTNVYTILTGFINPSYGALQDIVTVAQQLR